MKTNRSALRAVLAAALLTAGFAVPPRALGHCDTMDGPVVRDARTALEHKDVTPVLKWIQKDDELQIKTAFDLTLAVRAKGPEVRQLADQFFFETLVRVHRAGEGAPFTGLKPAGTPLEPAIREADSALESGSAERVVKLVTEAAAAGIRQRFAEVQEKQRHADHSVAAGREFVAAYVKYVHYVEGLHQSTQSGAAHHEGAHNAALEKRHDGE